ncbi:MAG: hypothetical protein VB022_09360 [Rikenellaceae bacterium]|nr:hypothetical protein [Rikenellaceae bacterium]
MKMTILSVLISVCMFVLQSCEKEDLSFESGDIEIEIKTGDHWLHDFPLFLGLTKKNPPQFVIWLEDTSENYISTVFATYKIATEGWKLNDGNRRKESLPHWCHQRGVVYEDGLFIPTKNHPLTDGITGATPNENKTIKITPVNLKKPFVIKAEFNHSVDFNNYYPKNAKKGDNNYSGGEMGSGQPAVVYSATIYPETKNTVLVLIGHSSSDGSDGDIYQDTQTLTTAKTIVKSINVIINK